MTLKHLLVNILGGGGKQTQKNPNQPKKEKIKKGMLWEIIYFSMCIHTQGDKHEHAGRCMGVCTILFR